MSTHPSSQKMQSNIEEKMGHIFNNGEYPLTLINEYKSLQIKLQAQEIQRKLPSHIKIKLLKINDDYKI